MDWLAQTVAEFGGFTQITASALLAVVVVMILRGDLVPRRRLDEARQDRDGYRAAWETEREGRIVAETDQGERSRMQELMIRLLNALTPPGERGGNGST